jgi:hypothetical protein
MADFELKGLNELNRKLEDLKRKAEALDGKHEIPFSELFLPEFMTKHTDFASLEEMFQASGFVVESQEDFKAIPDDDWENFIKAHTQFSSWKDMQVTAFREWTARKLGFR